ncbi:PucR family transcriptional regulator [Clostridium thailandense]|uniref:PucR family transcriptional regulator n=1 Tax=Clostridium thailandense TaxID=2794346 RepID=UPI00398A06C6
MYNYFGISLEQLLENNMLKGTKILAGRLGISRRITNVNVMEVPDIIGWVKKGEFLITTAYSIKDNISVLLELIPKLNEKGVAGLGIKVGRYIKELPQSIIDLAEELSFPIVQVPFNLSHTDVISIILNLVIEEQMGIHLKIEKFISEVMDIMVKGGTLKEIAGKLYENIGHPLAIYENISDSCEIILDIDSNIYDQVVNRGLIDKFIGEQRTARSKNLKNEVDGTYNESIDNINGKSIRRINVPIVIEKVEYGYIFIWIDDKELGLYDKLLIESYVHIIALNFVKRLSISNMESKYKLEFFNNLLSNDENRQNEAIESAKTFNFKLGLKYTVLVIYFSEHFKRKDIGQDKSNFNKNIIANSIAVIDRIAREQKEAILYVDKSSSIVILYGSDPAEKPELIKKKAIYFCKRIEAEILKRFKEQKLKIGIGRPYIDMTRLNKSYEQAKIIVEKINKPEINSILHYDDLGLYTILCFDGIQGELARFCNDTINPIVEYDKLNNTELIKTLKVYFDCNGNMRKISKVMFMHYNTIVYRIQKIKDITGIDFEDSDSRLKFELALKALELI